MIWFGRHVKEFTISMKLVADFGPIHVNAYMLLLFAFLDLWKEMGWLKFSDPYRTASSTTGGWSHWNILMCFIYVYHSEHYGLSFLDLTNAFFFLQGIHFHFCKYTLHVCYVFNVNLTDSFDDRRSQCSLI